MIMMKQELLAMMIMNSRVISNDDESPDAEHGRLRDTASPLVSWTVCCQGGDHLRSPQPLPLPVAGGGGQSHG